MIELTQEELKERLSDKIFHQISETADELGLEDWRHPPEDV